MNSRNSASRRNKKLSSRKSTHSYEQLEDRKLLAVDVGNIIADVPLLPIQPLTSDVHGDIGPNHIVQLTNDQYQVFSANGNELFSSDMEFFFGQIAGADLVIGQDMFNQDIIGNVEDARIVFDADSDRWFASGVVADEDGEMLLGNDILLAVSRTNNPLDGFQSVQFVGDTTGIHYNNFATLGVDANGVIISTNNVIDPVNNSTSVYALPKADLIGMTPSAINLSRFENLDPINFGEVIQFASNETGDSTTTVGIGTFPSSNTELSMIELTNVGTMDPVQLVQTTITVPFFDDAPDARQPNAVQPLNNLSPIITGNAVTQGGYLWTVHTVLGSAGNSAIRWYQLDQNTGNVINSGDIEDTELDFTYPSIAVNQFGGIAIGFTGSGVTDFQSASTYNTLGFTSHGLADQPTVTFPQAPVVVQQGQDNFVNVVDFVNAFGEYSATGVDPDDPFSFYSFQQYVAGNDIWGVAANEAGISAIDLVLMGDDDSNTLNIRPSAINSDWVEFEFDGVVTDTFEIAALSTLELNLGEGDDMVIIDNSIASVIVSNGITINGGLGADTLQIIGSAAHQFDVTGDGSGVLDLINPFTGLEILIGGSGDDVFTFNNTTTDWIVSGGDGNDIFDVRNSATGSFQLNGMGGDDTYRIPLVNFAMIQITDSPDAENDSLVGLGTPLGDTIIIDNDAININGDEIVGFEFAGVENLDFDGLEGDDVFDIRALDANASFFGNTGSDVFNVGVSNGNAGLVTSQLNIDGGEGPNRLVVSNSGSDAVDATITSDQIIGFTANPINYTGDFGDGADGIEGVIVIGSQDVDNFDVTQIFATNSVLVLGEAGDDLVNIRSTNLGDIRVDGQSGADTVRTTFAEVPHTIAVTDSGASSEERDRFSIRATDADNEFTIRNNRAGISGEGFEWSGVENIIFDTMAGNDVVNVSENDTDAIRIILGDGDDMGAVNGLSGVRATRFDGLSGEDTFQFNSSAADAFVQALGGIGDDEFGLGAEFFARAKVDGQEGDDFVSVLYASRDNRRVNARDTGTGGFDDLLIQGTPTADRLDLRPQIVDREGEFIAYDENTENLVINLLGSNDVINVFGTSADGVVANTGVGNDTINVVTTSSPKENVEFSFSLGSGTDSTTVYRVAEGTRFEVFGQAGNDSFNVGSTTTTNDGNLNRIRGELFLGGGSDTDGFDTLQINDFGSGESPFQYSITDRTFAHVPGEFNLTRPFESFNYNSMEFIFALGTEGRNTFIVTPSLEAIIRVDGNGSNSPIGLGDQLTVITPPDVAVVSENSDGDGNGFLQFEDGFRNVSFQETEIVEVLSTGGFAVGLDELLSDLLVDAIVDLDA